MNVKINNKEYTLKPMTTGIYIDLLYILYYSEQSSDIDDISTNIGCIQAQTGLVCSATDITKEQIKLLHPEEFFNIVNIIQEYYISDPFWNTPEPEDKPKKNNKFKVIKK